MLKSGNSSDIESAACSHVEERHKDTEKPTLTGVVQGVAVHRDSPALTYWPNLQLLSCEGPSIYDGLMVVPTYYGLMI